MILRTSPRMLLSCVTAPSICLPIITGESSSLITVSLSCLISSLNVSLKSSLIKISNLYSPKPYLFKLFIIEEAS